MTARPISQGMSSRPTTLDGGASPLVSVVIPTHDRSDHLPGAIRSVADQTYDEIELIVVDDGSPVSVTQTLEDLPADELHSVEILRHQENRGANVARNTGIRAATGDYVAFLDDDDRWYETKVARQLETFQQTGPEVGVVYTGIETEGERGNTTLIQTAEGNVIKALLTGKTFGQFSSVMVRTDVVEEAGLPDERFPAWQDREWFFRLAKHSHFKPVEEPLTYRQLDLSDRIGKNFEEKREVAYPLFVDKHYEFAREFGLYYARTFVASLRMNLAWSAIQGEQYREARKFFWLAFFANPLYRRPHAHLLPSLGGKWTYEGAAKLRRKLLTARSSLLGAAKSALPFGSSSR